MLAMFVVNDFQSLVNEGFIMGINALNSGT